jgi:hypothetical protein
MQNLRALGTLADRQAPVVFTGFLSPLVSTFRKFRSYAHINPVK